MASRAIATRATTGQQRVSGEGRGLAQGSPPGSLLCQGSQLCQIPGASDLQPMPSYNRWLLRYGRLGTPLPAPKPPSPFCFANHSGPSLWLPVWQLPRHFWPSEWTQKVFGQQGYGGGPPAPRQRGSCSTNWPQLGSAGPREKNGLLRAAQQAPRHGSVPPPAAPFWKHHPASWGT